MKQQTHRKASRRKSREFKALLRRTVKRIGAGAVTEIVTRLEQGDSAEQVVADIKPRLPELVARAKR